MKKLIVVLAILSLSGIAFGAGIPTAVEPQNSPEIWTMEVYNNSGAVLQSGMVVVWDFENSSSPAIYTDRLMYVTTTATTDHVFTAGVVVDDTIPITGVGTICVWGPVYVLCQDAADAVTVSGLVGTSTTTGTAGAYSNPVGADYASLGVALASGPNTLANGGYGGTAGNDWVMIPVLVDISRYSP